MIPRKKKKYYAYFVSPAKTGVTDRWTACEAMVSGKPGARFKAFERRTDAEEWLARGARYEQKAARSAPPLVRGIYFDAGTGRGEGVEISVTDERGKDLLHNTIARTEINRFGKHRINDTRATNNYGELLALKHAIAIARAEGIARIFGDSRLVIDYWSRRRIKRKDLPGATVALADEVARLREEFEQDGGSVERISGDHNPADLGFHREG